MKAEKIAKRSVMFNELTEEQKDILIDDISAGISETLSQVEKIIDELENRVKQKKFKKYKHWYITWAELDFEITQLKQKIQELKE